MIGGSYLSIFKAHWLGGVLVRLMGRMGLVYGNLLGRVGGISLDTLNSRRG
jgi:hypothetical protein